MVTDFPFGLSYLITDYCPHGELYHYIISQWISPEMVLRFFSQLISAVHLEFLFPRADQLLCF